jgi:hypothetical protein
VEFSKDTFRFYLKVLLQKHEGLFESMICRIGRDNSVIVIITYLLRPKETVRSRGHKTHCFPEVSVNKCFVI